MRIKSFVPISILLVAGLLCTSCSSAMVPPATASPITGLTGKVFKDPVANTVTAGQIAGVAKEIDIYSKINNVADNLVTLVPHSGATTFLITDSGIDLATSADISLMVNKGSGFATTVGYDSKLANVYSNKLFFTARTGGNLIYQVATELN